ncbi:MAG: hypothetical protein GIKADHBN_00273 [Phycisphaerales bacterium]|nr:hypothetical protein [Phycisphaerales bacterium]
MMRNAGQMRVVKAAVLVGVCGLAATAAGGPVCIGSAPTELVSLRASTFQVSSQEQAVVTAVGSGDQQQLVAAWSSRRQQAGRSGVFFQRLTADGIAIGGETRLGVWSESHQRSPVLARTADGMIAAWQSWEQDGDAGAIVARRFVFDPTAPEGEQFTGKDEVLVNATADGDQTRPLIAVDTATGHVMLAWTSALADGTTTVKYRVFDSSLVPVSDEIDVLDGESGLSAASASVTAQDGSFAVAFAVTGQNGSLEGARVKVVEASGAAGSEARLLGCGGHLNQIEPVIAATPDGLVAAWAEPVESDSGPGGYRVMVQRLDETGAAVNEPSTVAAATGAVQNAPAIEVMADGSFMVAFNQDDGDGCGVMARRFDAAGNADGDAFLLHVDVSGEQQLDLAGTARSVRLDDGRVAIAWSGNAGKGDSSSANLTIAGVPMGHHGLRPAAIALGVRPDMTPAAFSDQAIREETSRMHAEPHVPPTFDRTAIDRSPRTVVQQGRSIGFDAVINTGWTPPDPHMAIGPSHVGVMTNGRIAFFLKATGAMTFQDEIEDAFGFWGSVGATGFVFDPEIVYDETSGRWFAMAAEAYAPPGQTKSYVLVAVSDDSDPNGTWYKYRFDTTTLAGNLFDSPNIGVSSDTVLITGDGFGAGTNYPVYTLRKSDLLAGVPTSFVRSTTLATTTQSAGYPPVSFDNPPAIYLLEHQEGANRTQVRLIAVQNPFTGPSFTTFNLTVPSYSAPGDPVQQGTTSRPESFDARFWSVAYRNGSLWGTHHVNTTVQARWYEIAMNGWPTSGNNPSLVQSGTIAPGASVNTTFSSITVSDSGDAAVCYAYSSATNFLSMATSYRISCDPLNTMRPSVIHKASNSGYTAGRWGDYSAVQVDPVDGRTFWAIHEYQLGGSWRTWVQSFLPDSCPCPADFDGSGFVDTDDYDAFVLAFEAGTDNADFDGSGFVDTDDFDAFVLAFEAGC